MSEDHPFASSGTDPQSHVLSIASWALLLSILLAGAALRLAALDRIPPGLTHDEANNVADAAGVLRGICPLFFPVAQGKEPLYPYSLAGMMALLGQSPFVMRLTTAFWGVLLLAATFAAVRRLFAVPEALLTTAWLAVSFWGFTTSRMGLRAVTLPLFFSLSLYWLYRSTLSRGGLPMEGRRPERPSPGRYPVYLPGCPCRAGDLPALRFLSQAESTRLAGGPRSHRAGVGGSSGGGDAPVPLPPLPPRS